ncbi:MAG: energy transducer TonB [Gammaproteobacteria bacterium]|nr:energy transducer TonB [Gammaproteobacteria bacterium]
MNSAALHTSPPLTSGDRLGLMLCVAVVIHAVVILGITFAPVEESAPKHEDFPDLEVTLVHQRSDEAPEQADLLAQSNQQGGGDSATKGRPSSPLSVPSLEQQAGDNDAFLPPTAPQPEQQQLLPEVLTRQEAEERLKAAEQAEEFPEESPSAAELIRRSMVVAKLSAEIRRTLEQHALNLKHRHISASTREYRDAVYLDAWQAKIERIGNLNYPEAAKRQKLSGRLTLDVAINRDGTVLSVNLLSSSGHKLLDDAAVRIVRLAAPFAPLSNEMREDTDVLHITRSWVFHPGNRLETK